MNSNFIGSWSDEKKCFSFKIKNDNDTINIECRHDCGWGGQGVVSNLSVDKDNCISFTMKFPLNEFKGIFILSSSNSIKAALMHPASMSTFTVDFHKI